MLDKVKHIHFIAVGGIGMSGIARLFLEKGLTVSGCDTDSNSLTESLAAAGARIQQGHDPGHLDDSVQTVVFSSAIKEGHPELLRARSLGIPCYRRAQALAELMTAKRGIAVTGTHGKTTVSVMIAHILLRAGLDPSFAIGAEIPVFGGNARWGKGDYFVAETDESDGSQVCSRPEIAVITNLDRDHLEYYTSNQLLIEKMERFIAQLPADGLLVAWGEDSRIREMLARVERPALTYGFSADNDFYATNINLGSWETSFILWNQGRCLGPVKINLPGRHNVLNTLAAVAVALRAGVSFTAIQRATAGFPPVKRRLEVLVAGQGITVIDDYAHHPAEIEAVVGAAAKFKQGRLIGVFQPHRFTRTKFLYREFAPSFRGLDLLLLTDIYGAGELPVPGVDGRLIYNELLGQGKPACVYFPALTDIPGYLLKQIQPQDTILFLGAGTITDIARSFKNLVKDSLKQSEPLSGRTTLKVGGPARLWFEPRNVDQLKDLVRNLPDYRIIGNGSNLLVADAGVSVPVIKLSQFNTLAVSGRIITAGAGAGLGALTSFSLIQGLSGLEFLSGIPGTVGGAVKTNSGAWNRETADVLTEIEIMNSKGEIEIISRENLRFDYRSSGIDERAIVVAARFKLTPAAAAEIENKQKEYRQARQMKIPQQPSAGSVFKNPGKIPSGQIIDRLGLKGTKIGRAMVSPQHANIIVNLGGARAEDVWLLIEYIKKEVLERTGIKLELELECWGGFASDDINNRFSSLVPRPSLVP